MKTYLVVEGPTDAIVMRTLIAATGPADVEVIDAGGKSSAMSLGNSIALSRRLPVAILVDADTTDERSLKEQRMAFDDLQRYSPPDIRSRLFLGVPTLEEDLFPTAETFASIFGQKLTPRQEALFASDRRSVIKAYLSVPAAQGTTTIRHGEINAAEAKDGWNRPLLKELLSFLRNSEEPAKSSVRR